MANWSFQNTEVAVSHLDYAMHHHMKVERVAELLGIQADSVDLLVELLEWPEPIE